jgi:hypothetical protein
MDYFLEFLWKDQNYILTVSGTNPQVGLIPTCPQRDAGIRIDPPPSAAILTGPNPAACKLRK